MRLYDLMTYYLVLRKYLICCVFLNQPILMGKRLRRHHWKQWSNKTVQDTCSCFLHNFNPPKKA